MSVLREPSRACPANWPSFTVQQGLPMTLNVQLVDNTGNNLVLNNDGALASPGITIETKKSLTFYNHVISIEVDQSVDVGNVQLFIRDYHTSPNCQAIPGTYKGNGLFTFNISGGATSVPGIYLADIQIYNSTPELIYVKNCFLEIEYNLSREIGEPRPITISEIRMHIRDSCPDANYLLDDVEFSDREILSCMQKPIDMWNETPPPVSVFTYTDFPYRYHHLEATTGMLLKLGAHHYRRNHLRYSAAGVSIDDKDKYREYDAAGDDRLKAYKEWMMNTKIMLNINGGYGYVPGYWAR